MSDLKIWFLDVGHGDCAYIKLPNGARMMIDCGGGNDNWPSKLLNYYKVNKTDSPVPLPMQHGNYGLDNLVITHPHGDHLSNITAIHDEIGFYLLDGDYRPFIDKISDDAIDFRKRGKQAAIKFKDVVNKYSGEYLKDNDRVYLANPDCIVEKKRFISYDDGIDLNEISLLVSIKYGIHKILFTGDLTAAAVSKILKSDRAVEFKEFVKGTSVLKIPHHGRENGCSEEMFSLFDNKPILCVASDEVLNDRNQGTSNIDWYTKRTSDTKVSINNEMQNRKVLTTRNDKDIMTTFTIGGNIAVLTNCFSEIKGQIMA